jgi:hypothetical protein
MRWKSSRISASACFGAFRSRLRSPWTQQRWTASIRPHQPNGASQPGIAVDNGEYRCSQAARYEIVEAAIPRRERLASAQLEGE